MRKYVFDDEDAANPGEAPQTTAAEWRALRTALTDRLQTLRAERDEAMGDTGKAKLDARIEEARLQIQALAVEEGVARFAEDSERYILASSVVREELSRDPDAEIA